MTRTQEQQIADRMIGAAQRLEVAARTLKDQATLVRKGVLHRTHTVELWTMHKAADIRTAADRALAEIAGGTA